MVSNFFSLSIKLNKFWLLSLVFTGVPLNDVMFINIYSSHLPIMSFHTQ